MAEKVIVYPKPGVAVHLPGSVEGFFEGPVPMDAAHAEALHASGQVMTEVEWQAANPPKADPVTAPAAPAKGNAADPAV